MRSATRTSACVLAVAALAPAALAQPENDNCIDAQTISGLGFFDFDNSHATTDGDGNDAICCTFASCDVFNDLWFCWTSTLSGYVAAYTCELTGLDTKIAVYSGCTCPTGAGIIVCNDDWCSLQSRVEWFAETNREYLIRLGTSFSFQFGSGHFAIAVDPCPADLNDDAAVDLQDLASLLAHFGINAAAHWEGDVDGDTDIDLEDLTTLLAAFGTSCP